MIYIYLLFALSQVFRAIHNTLKDHFEQSKFSHLDKWFWNETWFACHNKYIDRNKINGHRKLFWFINIPDTFTSAWHIFNTLEIFTHFAYVSIALYLQPAPQEIPLFIAYAFISYNVTFNIFYNWLLIRNKTFIDYAKTWFK